MKLSLKQGLLCVAVLSAAAWQLAISAPAPEVDHAQMPQIIDDLPADYAADLTAEQRTLVDRGRYIARLGDCVACHTGNKTQPMGGGLALETPFGKIYSTNISPDADTGMGKYSFEQFDRAMRKGVAADGRNMYPAMPYPSYAKMTAEDMQALYAYLLQGVAPVKAANKESDLGFPFNQRWGLALWNWVFLDDAPFQPQPQQTAQWNRGAYLVQGLGHCGACHTPRGLAFQEKAMDDSGGSGKHFLAGETVEHWRALSLRNLWTVDDTVQLLKTGQNRFATVSGNMAEVISHSTQHFTDADLTAIARYLKSLPAGKEDLPMPNVALSPAPPPSTLYSSRGGLGYTQFCSDCHRPDGAGVAGLFPPLAHNPSVASANPTSLLHITLTGWKTAQTQTHPRVYTMPGFARLADQEIAEILSFVRSSWGNNGSAISAAVRARPARRCCRRRQTSWTGPPATVPVAGPAGCGRPLRRRGRCVRRGGPWAAWPARARPGR